MMNLCSAQAGIFTEASSTFNALQFSYQGDSLALFPGAYSPNCGGLVVELWRELNCIEPLIDQRHPD